MQVMFFGKSPAFGAILDELRSLENGDQLESRLSKIRNDC